MFSKMSREAIAYIEYFVSGWPGKAGFIFRRWFYGRRFNRLGEGAIIGSGLLAYGARNITIGKNFTCGRLCSLVSWDGGLLELGDRVSLNANVHINAAVGGRIVVGSDVMIGPNAVMRASDHSFASVDKPINQQGHDSDEIRVEDDVWIAANATIVGGVRIGKGSVVAAGAVVTGDVLPYTVVGGVPAKFIKNRGEGAPGATAPERSDKQHG